MTGAVADLMADTMADAPPLLHVDGITKRFGGLAAVGGVSVDLWRNQIHAVIGPNGAGKSTLLKVLAGLLPRFGVAVAD